MSSGIDKLFRCSRASGSSTATYHHPLTVPRRVANVY